MATELACGIVHPGFRSVGGQATELARGIVDPGFGSVGGQATELARGIVHPGFGSVGDIQELPARRPSRCIARIMPN